jgi:hypothetical protein
LTLQQCTIGVSSLVAGGDARDTDTDNDDDRFVDYLIISARPMRSSRAAARMKPGCSG